MFKQLNLQLFFFIKKKIALIYELRKIEYKSTCIFVI